MNALMKYVSWYLIAAMFVIGIAPRVDAAFAPSEATALAQYDRTSDMRNIQGALESKMIRDRLGKLGLTPGEVQSRMDRLNDRQVHELALNLDQVKAGGDAGGVILALVVIAALVALIFYLSGGHKVTVT